MPSGTPTITAASSPRPNGTALTTRSWSKSPLSIKSTKPSAIRLGVVKNSVLIGTMRNIACQAAKNSATGSAPSIAFRCRATNLVPGDDCTARFATAICSAAIVLDHDFVFQRVPDFELEIVEFRRDSHLILAGTGPLDFGRFSC